MNCSQSNFNAEVCGLALEVGAVACGVARAGDVEVAAVADLDRWIADGNHASMAWMERHALLRRSTESVLPGARSVVVCAFNYRQATLKSPALPRFATYAYGRDYHEVVRRRLSTMVAEMSARWGGDYRVCVDTAPVSERYWAERAGVATAGRNCLLFLRDGSGSYFVVGEILTTLEIPPSVPVKESCPEGCRRCVDACPGGALFGDGHLDARRCLSYLTIESRDALPDDISLCGQVYGCDICQRVCPRNVDAPATLIPEFMPTERFLGLTLDEIATMDAADYSCIFKHSAVKRAGLAGLQRNAARLLRDSLSRDHQKDS